MLCRPSVGIPRLSPLTSSTMDLLKIGLVSDKLNPFELRDRAEWVMKPALLAVPGVAHVIIFGGAVRQIQIQPDLVKRMTSYGFTLTDLADAARAALALRGAGFVDLVASAGADPDAGACARSRRRSPARCWRCAARRPSPSAMSPR